MVAVGCFGLISGFVSLAVGWFGMNKTRNIMKTKKCTKCGVEKEASLEFFYKVKRVKSGISGECRKCRRIRQRQYLEANPKRKKELSDKSKEWYKKNKDKSKEYYDNWCKNNKQKVKEYRTEWNAKNKNKRAIMNKKWQEKVGYKSTECVKKWRIKNPDRYIEVKRKAAPKKAKRQREYNRDLPDGLIRCKIKEQTGLGDKEITPEMIETKRLLILIKRELKSKQNEKTN